MSRMNRYNSLDGNVTRKRTEINKDLYNDLGKLEKYTTISDVSKIEAVEFDVAKNNMHTREGYHQFKDYEVRKDEPIRRELDEINFLSNYDTHKVYDINRVLEEAKELREKDSLERKRKLHNEKYNILESSEEELNKFKEEKRLRHKPIENESELEELINTITSKELRDDIDNANTGSLLSDLMATNCHEEIVKPIATKIDSNSSSNESLNISNDIDRSFYTKSLDLSEEDFESDDFDIKPSKLITFLKVIFSLILILAVALAIYYVITNF